MLLAVDNDRPYGALIRSIRRAEALDDPRFVDGFRHKENDAILCAIIEDALAAEHAKSRENGLNGAGAPSASIWRIEKVIDHPEITARGVMQVADTPDGAVRLMGSGFQMARGRGRLDTAPPELGAHTAEMLRAAGYPAEEIATLPVEAVICHAHTLISK